MDYRVWINSNKKTKNDTRDVARYLEVLFPNDGHTLLWYLEPHGEYLCVRTHRSMTREGFGWIERSRAEACVPAAVPAARYFFRVRLNTVKISGENTPVKMTGVERMAYLHSLGASNGFEVERSLLLGTGFSRAIISSKESAHWNSEFEGVLRVTKTMEFDAAVRNGIGRAKKHGYGMLLLRKLEDNDELSK